MLLGSFRFPRRLSGFDHSCCLTSLLREAGDVAHESAQRKCPDPARTPNGHRNSAASRIALRDDQVKQNLIL
jgi:hypothetical protein